MSNVQLIVVILLRFGIIDFLSCLLPNSPLAFPAISLLVLRSINLDNSTDFDVRSCSLKRVEPEFLILLGPITRAFDLNEFACVVDCLPYKKIGATTTSALEILTEDLANYSQGFAVETLEP